MKRIFALALALVMLCAAALADQTVNFDDFTITFDDAAVGDIKEKKDGEALFSVYPGYSKEKALNPNLDCTWYQNFENLDAYTPEEYAQLSLSGMVTTLDSMGIKITNPQVLSSEMIDLNGAPALMMILYYEADYTGAGKDLVTPLYAATIIANVEGLGCFAINATAADADDLMLCCNIIDTITWKK